MENTEKEQATKPEITEEKEERTEEKISKAAEEETEADNSDKMKPWQILIIVFTVLFSLGVFILFVSYGVFSLGGGFGKNTLKDVEKINTQKEMWENNKLSSQFSENPFDLQFIINGAMYQLPVTVSEVLEKGWRFGVGENSENVIAEGETAETYFTLSDGTYVFATLKNFGNEEITQQQAYIVGVKFDKDYISLKSDLTFIKNLSLGTSVRKTAEKAFGKCDDVFDTNRGVILTYNEKEKTVKFVFDNSTGVLKEAEYINTSVPEDFSETAFKQINDIKYKKPDDIGSNPLSGIVKIEGDLYKLPVPVSEFLKNGWEITAEDDKMSLQGNEYAFIKLKKDGITIPDVEIYNFERTKKDVKKCFVISMAVSSESEYEALLPKNIEIEMAEDDFLAAVSGLNCTLNSAEFNQYTFTDGKITLTADADKQENNVKYWILRYDVIF